MRALILVLLLTGCASSYQDNLWALNKSVSHRFHYVTDPDKWGEQEHHERDVTGQTRFSGDCEEYAYAMRWQLSQRGITSTVWHVINEQGGHAVTCTEDGYCLDYGRAPTKREDTGYFFLKPI